MGFFSKEDNIHPTDYISIQKHEEILKKEKTTLIDSFTKDKDILERETKLKFREDNATMLAENARLQSEVSMLNKAFDNLGFDVKDMKEILNKLVDGVVSKNTVNIVK